MERNKNRIWLNGSIKKFVCLYYL